MAGDWQGVALEKAEMLSGRLKELLTSGQDYVQAQFGVDLGLKPELYPTWLILSSAAAGLLLLLALSWAAVCGGVNVGKKRGCPMTQGSGEPVKASLAKTAKPEEQKKRNRKKTAEKAPHAAVTSCRITKSQSNGQPLTIVQEEAKVTGMVPKVSPHIKTEKVQLTKLKVHEVQAPVQVKKNKKKTKADVKPVKLVSTSDAKEPDDGAWETKVSNREKKQQRRKDKGPEDSGSSGGVEAPKDHVMAAAAATAPVNTKKNRGSQESLPSKTTGKVDGASGAAKASSKWREEHSVNGVGWTDISVKHPGQMASMDRAKWRNMATAPQFRGPAETQCWSQETQAWSEIDGRVNTERVSFSMQRLNTSDPISSSIELQWAGNLDVDDEWSPFNGSAAADPTSDWNAPAEHWGNYEEPFLLVKPAPLPKEQPVHNKVSENEKDAEDPSGGAAKSKKKRRKKKKTEEEAASEAQVVSTAPVFTVAKPQEPPVKASKKQNPSTSSSQQVSGKSVEPPKPSQKKKIRKET
ncbi:LYRIC-like isoform X2 [Solea senegalensis]|uniref:LYRIC-like isoform X2 n=1 Tax=Solea senegalensis TaxID=28829 RepID=A0AAV6R9D8_SOLSE|nr:metadherin a isoform X2 [Solea senegalensis]KAG7501294.1 LYRIC-like isoform X2 [Solea senegalensis]